MQGAKVIHLWPEGVAGRCGREGGGGGGGGGSLVHLENLGNACQLVFDCSEGGTVVW
jgi:hypothetical protein